MLPPDARDQAVERWFAERHRDGLTVLYENHFYAEHRLQSSTKFAVSIQRLRAAGMDDGELQWLMLGGYVLHVRACREPTPSCGCATPCSV